MPTCDFRLATRTPTLNPVGRRRTSRLGVHWSSHVSADFRREHDARIVPSRTDPNPLPVLAGSVYLERRQDRAGNVESPLGPVRLGIADPVQPR
jgi:hypothetical protein